MLDKSKLNKQAFQVFKELVKIRPEWEALTNNFQFTYGPVEKPHTKTEGFKITIPCPFLGNPPIEIEVENIDLVQVTFGLPFEEFDMNYPFYEKSLWTQLWISAQTEHIKTPEEGRSSNYITKEIIKCVDELMQEKLISAEWRTKRKSGWQCGLIKVDYYQELTHRVYFIRSVSWSGNFNRSFDGKWEWGTNY